MSTTVGLTANASNHLTHFNTERSNHNHCSIIPPHIANKLAPYTAEKKNGQPLPFMLCEANVNAQLKKIIAAIKRTRL